MSDTFNTIKTYIDIVMSHIQKLENDSQAYLKKNIELQETISVMNRDAKEKDKRLVEFFELKEKERYRGIRMPLQHEIDRANVLNDKLSEKALDLSKAYNEIYELKQELVESRSQINEQQDKLENANNIISRQLTDICNLKNELASTYQTSHEKSAEIGRLSEDTIRLCKERDEAAERSMKRALKITDLIKEIDNLKAGDSISQFNISELRENRKELVTKIEDITRQKGSLEIKNTNLKNMLEASEKVISDVKDAMQKEINEHEFTIRVQKNKIEGLMEDSKNCPHCKELEALKIHNEKLLSEVADRTEECIKHVLVKQELEHKIEGLERHASDLTRVNTNLSLKVCEKHECEITIKKDLEDDEKFNVYLLDIWLTYFYTNNLTKGQKRLLSGYITESKKK